MGTAIVPAIVVITVNVGVSMKKLDKEIAAKANMDAVDALEKRVQQKDKVSEDGKVTIPVNFSLPTLEAVQEIYDQLGSADTTKSDTVQLCVDIAYVLFKEIQAGGEVYVKPYDQENPDGTEIYTLTFPGMVDENLPSIDDPSIQSEIPVHEDVLEGEEDAE